MAAETRAKYQDLSRRKAFTHVGTVMADGSPQVTPIWFDHHGTYLCINSAKGRWKDTYMRARPKVALEIHEPDNPYQFMQIRGTSVQITEDGADDHIDALTKKYLDQDKYSNRQPGEVRVIYTIEAERVSIMG